MFEPSPLVDQPISPRSLAFLNQCYLETLRCHGDSAMVWTTEVDMQPLRRNLRALNANSDRLLTPAHALLKAVADSLTAHPELNSRVFRRRIYRYRDVNLLVPIQRRNRGLTVRALRSADRLSLEEIATALWSVQGDAIDEDEHTSGLNAARNYFEATPYWLARRLLRLVFWMNNHWNKPMGPLDRHLRISPVLVNYFGFAGAPPLLAYQPSRLPTDGLPLNVTLGPAIDRPVVVHEEVVVRPMATLVVRADHRLVDAYELAAFVSTLRRCLQPAETSSDDLIGAVHAEPIAARRMPANRPR